MSVSMACPIVRHSLFRVPCSLFSHSIRPTKAVKSPETTVGDKQGLTYPYAIGLGRSRFGALRRGLLDAQREAQRGAARVRADRLRNGAQALDAERGSRRHDRARQRA